MIIQGKIRKSPNAYELLNMLQSPCSASPCSYNFDDHDDDICIDRIDEIEWDLLMEMGRIAHIVAKYSGEEISEICDQIKQNAQMIREGEMVDMTDKLL